MLPYQGHYIQTSLCTVLNCTALYVQYREDGRSVSIIEKSPRNERLSEMEYMEYGRIGITSGELVHPINRRMISKR